MYVVSDTSNFGLGAVLLHKEEDSKLKPIHHALRTLLLTEMSYSKLEKEGLAIIFAIKKFPNYRYSWEFMLQTDHHPLLVIFSSKKGIPTHTVNHLQRWAMILLNYPFKMECLLSKEIVHADGLPILIPKTREPLEEMVIGSLRSKMYIKYVLYNSVKELPVTLEEIRIKQNLTSSFLEQIKKLMSQNIR